MTYCVLNTNSQHLCNNGLMTEIKISLWMNISFIKGTTVKQPDETCTCFFYKVLYCFHPPGLCVLPISAFPTTPAICHKWFALSHLISPRGKLFLNGIQLFVFWFLVGFLNSLASTPCSLLVLGKAGLKLLPCPGCGGRWCLCPGEMQGGIGTWGF